MREHAHRAGFVAHKDIAVADIESCLERKRPVADELDPVEVVGVTDVPRLGLAPPGEGVAKEARNRCRPNYGG